MDRVINLVAHSIERCAKPINFVHVRAPLLDPRSAELVLEVWRSRGEGVARASLDLWLSTTEFRVRRGVVELSFGAESTSLPIELIEEIAESTSIYVLTRRSVEKLAVFSEFSNMLCRLRFVSPRVPPTIEIGGIHMHRIEGCDPWRDTLFKVRALGRRLRGSVLDTCMGLGYTAIASLMAGAEEVVTIEIDPAVIALAMLNPWSRALATARSRGRALVLLGDSSKVVRELPPGIFDYVIHDPPRFELAGELYSLEMYRELLRVLKPGGKVFHYTGEPGRARGKSIVKGVKERLAKAGFVEIRWVENARGFVARKPRR